jgi:hypothetical protein
MITAKEKAQELRERCDGYTCYAEIVVDEILTADMFMMTEEQEKYWEQVKQELEKL